MRPSSEGQKNGDSGIKGVDGLLSQTLLHSVFCFRLQRLPDSPQKGDLTVGLIQIAHHDSLGKKWQSPLLARSSQCSKQVIP